MDLDSDTGSEEDDDLDSHFAPESLINKRHRQSPGVRPPSKASNAASTSKRRARDASGSSEAHDGHAALESASTLSAGSPTFELGGSISRSARMRATTTDEEQGSSSDGEDGDGRSSIYGGYTSDPDREGDEAEEQADADAINTAFEAYKESAKGRSFVTASTGEAYLHSMARPAKTSNKKLSENLASRRPFTQTSFLAALETYLSSPAYSQIATKLAQVEESYMKLFDQWLCELEEGFSVFLYGLGSKSRLIHRFATQYLRKKRKGKGRAIVVNGYDVDLGLDHILTALEELIRPQYFDGEENAAAGTATSSSKMGKSAAKLDERAKDFVEKLQVSTAFSPDQPIYLLVNNIDGVALRSYRAQAILSLLAAQPQICLMATVDHIKAALLFPTSIASTRRTGATTASSASSHAAHAGGGYNIIWHHVPTHQPYTTEILASGTMSSIFGPTIFLSDLLVQNGMAGGLGGAATSESRAKAAWFVLASLTQKAKDLFVLLAERQMAASSRSQSASSADPEKTPPYATLYPSLLSLSRDSFLANNLNQLEALLREFRDHSIVLSSRSLPEGMDPEDVEFDGGSGAQEEVGQRAGEWLWIPIDREDLEGLLERLQG